MSSEGEMGETDTGRGNIRLGKVNKSEITIRLCKTSRWVPTAHEGANVGAVAPSRSSPLTRVSKVPRLEVYEAEGKRR